MDRVEDGRTRWQNERPKYEAFAKLLRERFLALLKRVGFYHDVTARAKDLDSLVKKLLKKEEHTFESLPDKVGLRVVVRYVSDLDPVLELLSKAFSYGKIEDKLETLGTDAFGYLRPPATITFTSTPAPSERALSFRAKR